MSSQSDQGYIVDPYQVVFKPVVLDPESFNPRKGILTRYGRKLLEEGKKFYGTHTIKMDDRVAVDDSVQTPKQPKYRSIDAEWGDSSLQPAQPEVQSLCEQES